MSFFYDFCQSLHHPGNASFFMKKKQIPFDEQLVVNYNRRQ